MNQLSVTTARRGPRRNLSLTSVAVGPLAIGALLASTVAAFVTASAAPASAAPAVTRSASAAPLPRAFFGLGPASATKIDGREFFNWSATPGARLSDHVAVVNFGTTALALRVYVTNAAITTNGATGFVAAAQAHGGPAGWVTIGFPHHSSVLYLRPRSQVILPISVLIPKNAPPGDQVGAVIASLTSVIQSKHHAKVHFVQQVADRIILRISGPLHPSLTLRLKTTYHDPLSPVSTAPADLTFTVKNTGNVLLGGKVTLSVHGLLGSAETSKDVISVPVLLPGASDHGSVVIGGVYPEFLMHANASLVPVIVSGQYDPGVTTYLAQDSFLAIPWILLIIVILIVLVIVAIWLRRRRRRGPAATSVARGRPSDRTLVEVDEQ